MGASGNPEGAGVRGSGEEWAAGLPAGETLELLFAEQQRLWRRMLSVPRAVEAACALRVGTSAHDVVLRSRMVSLLRYRRDTPAIYSEPVIFCYALINRPYILDLQPDKSLIQLYLERGFDVYMIDWGVPTYADRGLTLDDYICGFLTEIVRFVLRETGGENLHLLGYCMGGTMAALFTALHPGLVRTLSLLAAPIDFATGDSLLNCWTAPRYFDVDALIDTYGNCPAWFLQSCFLFMRPVQNLVEKYIAFYEQMDDLSSISNHLAMERWVNDNIPVAGETFRGFVRHLYQANELVLGRLSIGGMQVDLGQVACPLLLLTAGKDHLVPPSSTEGIRPHVASPDIRSMMIDAGHVGLVVGKRARRSLWPEAAGWLADRSTPAAGSR